MEEYSELFREIESLLHHIKAKLGEETSNTGACRHHRGSRPVMIPEEKLGPNSTLWHLLFNENPNSIVLSTCDEGLIIAVNRSFSELTGYRKEESIGKTSLGLGLWTCSKMRQEIIAQLIEAGRLTIDPVMVRTKSGDMRQTVVSATVVEFDDRKCMLSSTATVDGRQVASDTHEADSGLSLARCRQIDEIREIIEGMSNQQNEDSRSLSEKIEENLNKNILPFVTKLKAEKLNDNAQTYLAIIENGLNTLSSFLHRNDTFSHIGLTPNETRVAKLVQHGKTSKEIASMLNVSLSAVSFHRNNIRKKIGISQSKIALADFLNSR